MLLEIETKTVDVNTWNALIFIVTSLITILLGIIAWYQKGQYDKVNSMASDISAMKVNGEYIKEDVERIKEDMDGVKKSINDHEKRIYRLEKVG